MPPQPALLHPDNVAGAPGSTCAGVAVIFGAISAGLANGPPNNLGSWILLGASVLGGVGAMLSRA